MKRIFVHDEIIAGVNDGCVIPARGRNNAYAAKLYRLLLEHLAAKANPRRKKSVRDSVSRPLDHSIAKLDRKVADLERAISDHPGAGPSVGQIAQAYLRQYEENQAHACAEMSAAYAARNPHKKEGQG